MLQTRFHSRMQNVDAQVQYANKGTTTKRIKSVLSKIQEPEQHRSKKAPCE